MIEEIIASLTNAQNNSDSFEDYEKSLCTAFKFLGYEANTIGGKGDTDVLLTANIGKESYKVDVDGKTTKNSKVSDAQINWPSLKDHKEKNSSDFVVVAGPGFAGGNLEKRAKEFNVCLLPTDDLIALLRAHHGFPFTLLELKELFAVPGIISEQVKDIISVNSSRKGFTERFRIIIEEMDALQSLRLGYFTFESLASRERIEELEIEHEDIESAISLLKLPFLNAVYEFEKNKYVLSITQEDIANSFLQISHLLRHVTLEKERQDKQEVEEIIEKSETVKQKAPRTAGTKYFEWTNDGSSIIATARQSDPYQHYCPFQHFKTILSEVISSLFENNVINTDLIFQKLADKDLSENRKFKGKAEEYKIRMTLGILEIENLLEWTGSKRPIEYVVKSSTEDIQKWVKEKFQI